MSTDAEQSAPNAAIGGVVVTYHPGDEVVDNLRIMARECGRLVVVDNGSSREACDRLSSVPGVELLAMGENRGVAAALNAGARWALEKGCEWLVTFDQDSRPQPGMVAALWETHRREPWAAIIGPRIEEAGFRAGRYLWVRRNPRWPWLFQRASSARDFSVTMVVTSGALTELGFWRELGGFDEALFIDYVDVDYCLRVIRGGRGVVVATGAVLNHRLGERQARQLLGREFRPMNHAVFRHYYMARNRIRIWRRHARVVPHWACFDLCFWVYNGFRVLAFERAKRAKLKAMVLGTWDGLRGRSGPCPQHRLETFQS